jgi:tetratricopeptide (TPR) repeat protein
MLTRLRLSHLILAPVLLICCLVSAEEPKWSLTGPAFSTSAGELLSAAGQIKAEPFVEATVFLERDAYSFDGSGRLTYRHTMIYRVETQAALDNWSGIGLQWHPWYQNAPEIHARVIAPDGSVSTLDQKTVTDGPAREDSEDTYTDARIRKAPLPGVSVGSIVELETVSADKDPFFSAGEVHADSFSRDVPIICAELTVDVPSPMKLRYQMHNLPNAHVKDDVKGAVRHLSVEQGYLPARANSDIDLATHNITGPSVYFSTGESWAEVASAYRKLAEAHIDPEKVKGLLGQGGGDRTAIVARLVSRLHKDVRYTGIEFGQASLQPATAAEVLKRHYGDCKDKAALLVAMLRAAGIPAHLALLGTGPGTDVDPELPGMNMFDHAIVYIPPSQGADALWIDATAEFAEVGTLPWADQDRLALVIAENTTSLLRTPAPKPEDDQLSESRDFVLADYGPATITEMSMTHGDVDSSYRSLYGGELTREQREGLENYANGEYLAKSLVSITHGEPHDLNKAFALKLEMHDAKRGNTALEDAVVGITFGDIFGRLPAWFRTDPKTEGEKLTPQQEDDRKRAIAARTTEYDVQPLLTEWQYTIRAPEGFELRALPENRTTNIGPAVLTQHYEKDAAGIVKANLRFELARHRLTIDEALALREAVLASYKQDMISIRFDQAGAKLAAAGKIREALATDRALIASHPTHALHHSQIAYVYLRAGLGGLARKEAERATELDPKSPVGFRTLGWVCQFNEIGVQFAVGFDWNCAAKALKKALALEPDDSDTAISLAYLNEYGPSGERYADDAHLADAIAGYRAVKAKDKSLGQQYDDHVLFDLLYSRQFKELTAELDKLASSPTRSALAVSAAVALRGGVEGIAAGVVRADHLAGGSQARNGALATAGNELLRLRMYPEAAGILSAAVEGQENSAGMAQQIAVFRQLTPWKGEYLPPSDPRSVVQHMFMGYMTGTFTEATASDVLTRHAYGDDEQWRRNLERAQQTQGVLHAGSERSGIPGIVLLDVIAANLKMTAQGDDESGHSITVQSLGSKPQHLFVTKEDGKYRIVTDGNDFTESGHEVLYLMKTGRMKEARSLLDWTRDLMHRGGGDDQLSGPLMPRFWTVGDSADESKMRLAAASILVDSPTIKELIPEVRSARENAAAGEARLSLSLLLAHAYARVEDGEHLREIAVEILNQYPDSYVAIGLAGRGYEMLKNFDEWSQMLDRQIAKHPGDEQLLRMKGEMQKARNNWAGDRAVMQQIFDSGKAISNDYNEYAWSAMFDNKIDDEVIKAARQANMLSHNSSFAEMHTLACLYAQQGKTAEARDLLLKSMASSNLAVPNSSVWFGLGIIYEQFGVYDAARDAYNKVEKPAGRVTTDSTWLLAQARLKALQSQRND